MLRADVHDAGPIGLTAALHVGEGECLALAGPSGAGKTTALRALAGLERGVRGRVACGASVWLDSGAGVDRPPEARRVGMVFQDHALFTHLSAWRNVAYALHGRPRGERRTRALALLAGLGLADRSDARPRELSGGERQRVALARALAREPAALLLDEPLSSLDARARASALTQLAAAIERAAVPTVLVTHDFAEAARLAQRIAVVADGRVVQEGTAAQLAARPRSAFVADFTGAVVLTGHARDGAVDLDGGGQLVTGDAQAHGPVAVTFHPWDVTLDVPGAAASASARNRLEARVTSVTPLGGRVRVGLRAGQDLAAEITPAAQERLGIVPRAPVVAVVKATAMRVVAR